MGIFGKNTPTIIDMLNIEGGVTNARSVEMKSLISQQDPYFPIIDANDALVNNPLNTSNIDKKYNRHKLCIICSYLLTMIILTVLTVFVFYLIIENFNNEEKEIKLFTDIKSEIVAKKMCSQLDKAWKCFEGGCCKPELGRNYKFIGCSFNDTMSTSECTNYYADFNFTGKYGYIILLPLSIVYVLMVCMVIMEYKFSIESLNKWRSKKQEEIHPVLNDVMTGLSFSDDDFTDDLVELDFDSLKERLRQSQSLLPLSQQLPQLPQLSSDYLSDIPLGIPDM
jgi:hypothetical protein